MRKRDNKTCVKNDREQNFIQIPSRWRLPKYSFGQLTKYGTIIGLEFICSKLKTNFGTGGVWSYWITENLDGDDISCYEESEIELFSLEEVKSLIDSEIEIHLSRIHLLVHQLRIAEKEEK